jgi:hypothetical protein
VLAHLQATQSQFEAELADAIGSEGAARIISAMISAILGEKHRLESLPGTRVAQ